LLKTGQKTLVFLIFGDFDKKKSVTQVGGLITHPFWPGVGIKENFQPLQFGGMLRSCLKENLAQTILQKVFKHLNFTFLQTSGQGKITELDSIVHCPKMHPLHYSLTKQQGF
jgi:hypothetical protein